MSRADRIVARYGERLTLAQVAEVTGWAVQTLHNRRAAGRCPFPTYRDGRDVYADAEHVAAYLDARAEAAAKEHAALMERLA